MCRMVGEGAMKLNAGGEPLVIGACPLVVHKVSSGYFYFQLHRKKVR